MVFNVELQLKKKSFDDWKFDEPCGNIYNLSKSSLMEGRTP